MNLTWTRDGLFILACIATFICCSTGVILLADYHFRKIKTRMIDEFTYLRAEILFKQLEDGGRDVRDKQD